MVDGRSFLAKAKGIATTARPSCGRKAIDSARMDVRLAGDELR